MASSSKEILEECKISPPQNSVETTKVSLSFFDIPWIVVPAVECIMFYDFPHPTMHFTQSILPQLKHSLSLALQLYFPLAGSLVCNPMPTEPYILYRDGDFVPLTVAQSNGDFRRLVGNEPKNAADFRPLVPYLSNEMSSLLVSSDGDDHVPMKVLRPQIALQVTIFPNSGISICVVSRHAIADGRTMTNFKKTWASLFKSRNDLSVVSISQPCHDRATVIKDPNGLLSLLCKQHHELGQSWDTITCPTTGISASVELEERFHATFLLGSHEITLLKNWITSRFDAIGEPLPLPYVSTYVVTGAFIWVCILKTKFNYVTKANVDNTSTEDSVLTHFSVLADCTEKLGVPKTYIGNCLIASFASLTVKDLVSENGLQLAAKSIMQKIKELETGILDKVPEWIPKVSKLKWSSGSVVAIAGSPKLGIYDTDFGWGKPKKIELVHIDKEVGVFTYAESRDEKGGVEVGVSLSKIDMEVFTSIFQHGLRNYVAKSNRSHEMS